MRRVMTIMLVLMLAGCGINSSNGPTVTPPATPTELSQNLAPRATVAPSNATPMPNQPTDVPTQSAQNPPTSGWTRPLAEQNPRIQGEDVAQVQQRLRDLGYANVGDVDGFYGPNTAAAVKDFQLNNKLDQTASVDQTTWDKLFAPDAIGFEGPPIDEPPSGNTNGKLVYLKPDGMTLVSMALPDQTEQVFATLPLQEGVSVKRITADPSGNYVGVYADNQENLQVLYIYRADGSLVSIQNNMTWARWSPDGSRFATNGLPQSGDFSMYLFNTEKIDPAIPLTQLPVSDIAWNADGSKLLTVMSDETNNNIMSLNLAGTKQETLISLPFAGEESWAVTSVQFAPDENYIYFYGGQSKNLGASGNGMQWWVVATQGGSAGCSQKPTGCGEPVALDEPAGNLVEYFQYSPDRSKVVFSNSFHNNACSSNAIVVVADAMLLGNQQFTASPNNVPNDGGVTIRGITWRGDNTLAFGQAVYTCTDTGLNYTSQRIFVWDPSNAEAYSDIADGSFPVWLK